jgi:hypothetical protein
MKDMAEQECRQCRQSRQVGRHSGQNRHSCWAEEAFMQGSACRHVKAGRAGRLQNSGREARAGRAEQTSRQAVRKQAGQGRQGVRLEGQSGMHAEQGRQSGRAGRQAFRAGQSRHAGQSRQVREGR